MEVHNRLPGAVTIFISAPVDELERRLRGRATESDGEIEDRVGLARSQLRQAGQFDHIIVNDTVEHAAAELERVVRRELETAGRMAT
jgi:guanylate kinase